jgi:YD repeat-containing protein
LSSHENGFRPLRTDRNPKFTGQVRTSTDPAGVVTRYVYDGSGNRTAVIRDSGGLNQTATATYNAVGDVVSADPNGNATTSSYDAARLRLSTTSPASAPAHRAASPRR